MRASVLAAVAVPWSGGAWVPAAAASLAVAVCAGAQAAPAGSAIAQIARQFDDHPIVLIGERHRYEQLHAFLQELLRDPGFICRADAVVVEFGNARLQELADVYASGGDLSEDRLRSLWRETVVPLTWNSPVYRQFYAAVREVNLKALCPRPLRLLLGDPPLDWSRIGSAKEYAPFSDRDGHLAGVVEREVLAKQRRALVLAGLAHAVKRAPAAREGPQEPSAAQLIERRHPGLLFSIATVLSAASAEALGLGPAPDFRVVRGSGIERADFRLIWKSDPDTPWPSLGEVVDGLLYLGAEQTFLYPPAAIYLDPAYLQELRRRARIIKEFNGQDFLPAIDELVEEARKPGGAGAREGRR